MTTRTWAEIRRSAWFRWASIAAAAGVVLAAELIAAAAGAPIGGFIVPDAVGALVFIVGGAVAWVRRPENFTGPVLVLSGALWVVGSNEGAPNGAIAAISYAFGGYYDLTLAYLALAFPTGRVDDAPGRAVLGLMAATLVTRSLARLLVNEPSVYYSMSARIARPTPSGSPSTRPCTRRWNGGAPPSWPC